MTKGKPWTVEEEKMLEQMLRENRSVRAIAKALGKTRDCVRIKIARLGLDVVQAKSERTTTTSLKLPSELPSLEEALKTLSAAMKALETVGLAQAEVLRLRSIIQAVKIYNELFPKYVDIRGFEAEVMELRKKFDAERDKEG